MARQYWAQPTRQPKKCLGPFAELEEAIKAVFDANPSVKEVLYGYGAEAPVLDIRWIRRDRWEAGQL
jgi:hypothetical protein